MPFTCLDIAIISLFMKVRDGGDLVIKREVSQCTSVYKNYFLGLVFATKGLLLVFGMFLAWETRKVEINESSYFIFVRMYYYLVTCEGLGQSIDSSTPLVFVRGDQWERLNKLNKSFPKRHHSHSLTSLLL